MLLQDSDGISREMMAMVTLVGASKGTRAKPRSVVTMTLRNPSRRCRSVNG